MFAYCRNNPVAHKDSQGFFSESCYDEILDLDDPDDINGSAFAYASNPIDAGYHYGVDDSIAANSSFVSGGLYGNGYSTNSTYGPNSGKSSTGPQSSNSSSPQAKADSPHFDHNQQALLDLLKPYKKIGMPMSEAVIAVEWGKEYGFDNSRIDLGHDNGTNSVTTKPHFHVGPYNHIRIY